ncbi:ankyrin repeat and SOCS box protein 5-like isoform X1 [Brienomyrus brachyistius]|uniref:ankyrin repeat and SOCS box protein 5-like isoform X1 n=1 Tax=Brienomyrus brachyistius TaxID=42636 RepID=UPI0020B1AC2E|nr:ankyrin repeat and SOCS box protein 5-like isoform X1 [Brienomyrus brachyistius]
MVTHHPLRTSMGQMTRSVTKLPDNSRPFAVQLSNVYLTILALFCCKIFVKITLNILTHFYVIKGNRKEAARISAEFYDVGQRHRSWADRSPLHEAASQGRLLTVRKLISQGCNVNVLTIDHVSPLHEASLSDHVACARALIEAGANVNVTSIDGITPLYNACASDSVRCAEVLLENGAKFQVGLFQPSPIHVAASKGCHATLEALIVWGADVDYDIPHMGTPLYIACVCKEFLCARILLNRGANVHKGRFLETPLHAAAQEDCTEIVKELLAFGADVNAKNHEMKRPVEVAPPSSLAEGFLLLYEAVPRPLSQLCRLSIRNRMGRSRLSLIPQLHLPSTLKKFLQYQ